MALSSVLVADLAADRCLLALKEGKGTLTGEYLPKNK